MKLRELILLVVTVLAGFGAGFVGGRAARPKQGAEISANRFELLSPSGNPVAFWGTDKGGNVVISFMQHQDRSMPRYANQAPLAFTGQEARETMSFGLLSTGSPFLNMVGNDGKTRAMLYLTKFQQPVFVLSDGKSEGRIKLGFVEEDAPAANDDRWALQFLHPYKGGFGVAKSPNSVQADGFFFVQGRNGKTSFR